MNKLVYQLYSLWGNYEITVTNEDGEIRFSTASDIEGFTDKEGSTDLGTFMSLLKEAGIEKWDSAYVADDSRIEDAVKWRSEYTKDGRMYTSEGEEGFWPYGHEKLFEALKLLDEDLKRFDG